MYGSIYSITLWGLCTDNFSLTNSLQNSWAHVRSWDPSECKFQRTASRDKKAFLSDQCKEIEENKRMGKTRDVFTRILADLSFSRRLCWACVLCPSPLQAARVMRCLASTVTATYRLSRPCRSVFWVKVKVESENAKSLQSCPTLCDPIDGSPSGSPVPGILQA